MVTRRAVLKGTAAASIGAIAAAHGATPVEAAGLECGFGNLEGGAVGGFYTEKSSFQVSLKFHKMAGDVFFKEQVAGGVAVFIKFFDKARFEQDTFELSQKWFPDLKLTELNFVKLTPSGAGFFIKNELGNVALAQIDINAEKGFLKIQEIPFSTDGEVILKEKG
jgi:hypothetical protein